jgi:hypothetical protein
MNPNLEILMFTFKRNPLISSKNWSDFTYRMHTALTGMHPTFSSPELLAATDGKSLAEAFTLIMLNSYYLFGEKDVKIEVDSNYETLFFGILYKADGDDTILKIEFEVITQTDPDLDTDETDVPRIYIMADTAELLLGFTKSLGRRFRRVSNKTRTRYFSFAFYEKEFNGLVRLMTKMDKDGLPLEGRIHPTYGTMRYVRTSNAHYCVALDEKGGVSVAVCATTYQNGTGTFLWTRVPTALLHLVPVPY